MVLVNIGAALWGSILVLSLGGAGYGLKEYASAGLIKLRHKVVDKAVDGLEKIR